MEQKSQKNQQSNQHGNKRPSNRNRNRYNKNKQGNKPPQGGNKPQGSILKQLERNTHLSYEHYGIVKSLRDTTNTIVQYIDPCSETQLLWSTSPNSWNIKEILAHLSQTNELYLERMIHVLEERPDDFRTIDPDIEIKKEEFSSYSIEHIMRDFLRGRKEIESLCMKTIDVDWEKSGNHPDKGMQTFKQIVQYVIEHDKMHVDQIFMNLQRHEPWLKEVPKEDLIENEKEENSSVTTETPIEEKND